MAPTKKIRTKVDRAKKGVNLSDNSNIPIIIDVHNGTILINTPCRRYTEKDDLAIQFTKLLSIFILLHSRRAYKQNMIIKGLMYELIYPIEGNHTKEDAQSNIKIEANTTTRTIISLSFVLVVSLHG